VVDDDVSISRSGPCRLMPGISRNASSSTVVDVSTFCSSFSVPSRLMPGNLLRSSTVVDDDVSISRSGPCRLMPGISRNASSSTVVDDDVAEIVHTFQWSYLVAGCRRGFHLTVFHRRIRL